NGRFGLGPGHGSGDVGTRAVLGARRPSSDARGFEADFQSVRRARVPAMGPLPEDGKQMAVPAGQAGMVSRARVPASAVSRESDGELFVHSRLKPVAG
ncbi:MAG: hypothetical protein PVI86_19825, partial [Phycisphaerae bacterium]